MHFFHWLFIHRIDKVGQANDRDFEFFLIFIYLTSINFPISHGQKLSPLERRVVFNNSYDNWNVVAVQIYQLILQGQVYNHIEMGLAQQVGLLFLKVSLQIFVTLEFYILG